MSPENKSTARRRVSKSADVVDKIASDNRGTTSATRPNKPSSGHQKVSKAGDVVSKIAADNRGPSASAARPGKPSSGHQKVSKAGDVVSKIAADNRGPSAPAARPNKPSSGHQKVSKAGDVIDKVQDAVRPAARVIEQAAPIVDNHIHQPQQASARPKTPSTRSSGLGCCALPFLLMILGVLTAVFQIF